MHFRCKTIVIDPMTGRRISPLVVAALCVKPRRQMITRQIANVDAPKATSTEFTTMRDPAEYLAFLPRGQAARSPWRCPCLQRTQSRPRQRCHSDPLIYRGPAKPT